jgi:hypothetical protein
MPPKPPRNPIPRTHSTGSTTAATSPTSARYEEAALAYDKAREIGLPLRMFRYQFGPFLAYFHSCEMTTCSY